MRRPPPETSTRTLAHYDRTAESFWEGTRDHDVTQNMAALLGAIDGPGPHTILDLGCGPGRDILAFQALGHVAVGLDGTPAFVEMARAKTGAEVLHQDFTALDLPTARFDGIFANASLFHVPTEHLAGALAQLHQSLKPGGVLFCSNPRGPDREGWNGERYGCYRDLDGWRHHIGGAGFTEVHHYYRPPGLPREQQPWLAMVWRR